MWHRVGLGLGRPQPGASHGITDSVAAHTAVAGIPPFGVVQHSATAALQVRAQRPAFAEAPGAYESGHG